MRTWLSGCTPRSLRRSSSWSSGIRCASGCGRSSCSCSTAQAGRRTRWPSTRRAHRTFADELGIEPGARLRELQRAILAHDPALEDVDYALAPTLERAATMLAKEPPDRIRSLLDYGSALVRLGEMRHAASTFRAAQRMAAAAGEWVLEERALLKLSRLECSMHRTKGPLAHLDAANRAAGIFERFGDGAGLAEAVHDQGAMLAFTGRCGEGAVAADRARSLAREAGNRWQEAAAAGILAFCFSEGPLPLAAATARCGALRERGRGRGFLSCRLRARLALRTCWSLRGRTPTGGRCSRRRGATVRSGKY